MALRHVVKLGIWALMVFCLASAALTANSVCVAGSSRREGIILQIDSGASKHVMSAMSLFRSFDEAAPSVSFSTAAVTIHNFACCWYNKFKALDSHREVRILALDNVCYVIQQQPNPMVVCQRTHWARNT